MFQIFFKILGILFYLHEMTYKQDRQCTYNVILRPVRVTFVTMEKQ
jgi:hypothetical protein